LQHDLEDRRLQDLTPSTATHCPCLAARPATDPNSINIRHVAYSMSIGYGKYLIVGEPNAVWCWPVPGMAGLEVPGQ
jgi:hypothetical protein